MPLRPQIMSNPTPLTNPPKNARLDGQTDSLMDRQTEVTLNESPNSMAGA